METAKREAIEVAGWKVGDAADFLAMRVVACCPCRGAARKRRMVFVYGTISSLQTALAHR
jgi:hypothetical protein